MLDSNGKWEIHDGIKILTEPSEKWIQENQTKSPEQIKSEQKQAIQIQLETLDISLNRGTEDLFDVLISKNIINEQDLPFVKEKSDMKKTLRNQLKNL